MTLRDFADRALFTPLGVRDVEWIQGSDGYQWWLGPPAPDGRPGWIAGFGNGGQRLFLGPRLGVIVLVLAGCYNQPDAWTLPVRVITEIVRPGLARR